MYEEYWQLERKPFEPTSLERNYYPSETHQGALLKLRYALESRRGVAVLAGPTGTGKTLLVETLRRQLGDDFRPFVHLVFPRMQTEELLRYLAASLGVPREELHRGGIDVAVDGIQRFLAENTAAGRHAIVAIDEADLLCEDSTLDIVRLLLNFELAGRPGLTLLLAGQTPLLPALARMPSLDDRVGVKILLRPLGADETAAYISHRLTSAGAARPIFDAEAMQEVYHLTQGVPRQINRLCDLALLIGFAEEHPSITGEQILAVSQELLSVAPR